MTADVVALTGLLAPDVVLLVADAGLGTLNSVRLSVDALAGAAPVVVVLNRYDQGDDLHVRNRRWLTEEDGLAVVTMPGGEEALATRCTRESGTVPWEGGCVRSGRGVVVAGLALALSGLVAAAWLALPGAAQASVVPSAAKPTYYVSVGDSYSVGYQPGVGATTGYTGYVAKKTHLTLANFGCGGATTTSIIDTVGCPDVLPHTAGAHLYPDHDPGGRRRSVHHGPPGAHRADHRVHRGERRDGLRRRNRTRSSA